MKAKQLQTLFLAILLCQGGIAQVKRDIIEEDPKLAPNFRLELSPIDLRDESYFGASIRAAYRSNNKFTLIGELTKEYIDSDNDYEELVDYAGFGFGVGGTFHFAKKEKEYEQRVKIKARQVSHNTVEVTVDDIPVTKLSLWGLRGGYQYQKSSTPVYADISDVKNPADKISGTGVTPITALGKLYGGLSFTRIKNLKVEYPTYGVRKKQVLREFYADVIFNGTPKTDPVLYSRDGTATKAYNVDHIYDSQKIGYRVGIFSTPTGRLINCGYGLEYTTVYASTGTINFRLVLSLNRKLGFSEE